MREDTTFEFHPGRFAAEIDAAWQRFRAAGVLERIRRRDHTVWGADPAEISSRLAWLDSPAEYAGKLAEIRGFAESICAAGFTQAVLLGMGGSSLAPEVFRKVWGVADGWLDLVVLDSTHPEEIAARDNWIDWDRACFIVSTKSGGTAETLSLYRYFRNRVEQQLGEQGAGSRFIAITDPGSGLAQLAGDQGFRQVFLNNPGIGGRFSVYSYFGLLPAAFLGIDLDKLTSSGISAADQAFADDGATGCPAQLGVALGELARQGADKLVCLLPPVIAPFGAWLEQLVAESTGKQGKGILPVVRDRQPQPAEFREDCFYVVLEPAWTAAGRIDAQPLIRAGLPVARITLAGVDSLGSEFYRWELATACACHVIGVNPFDQPDVEAAKHSARDYLNEYRRTGELPAAEPTVAEGNIEVYSAHDYLSVEGALAGALGRLKPGGYVSVQAFLPRTRGTLKRLQGLAAQLGGLAEVPVTLGFGPRYLHSTGQYHKGGPCTGLHILLTHEPKLDIAIPDADSAESAAEPGFGTLLQAQALGDEQALVDAGRNVLTIQLKGELMQALAEFEALLAELNPA